MANSDKTFEYECDVVGLKFRCGKLEERLPLLKQVPIRGVALEREQENKYDENAIRVMFPLAFRDGKQMGFLPKEISAILAPLMDRGELVFKSAVLTEIVDDKVTTGRLALAFIDKR